MRCRERFSESVIGAMREAIADAGGREVLFVARLDGNGMLGEIAVAARGDETSVPALAPHMERGDVVVHNHPSGRLSPSKADLGVAGPLGSQGIGFFIVDNEVENLYAVAEPVERREPVALDPDRLAGLIRPGGRLSEILPAYEPRSGQVEMLEAVAACLNEGGILSVEAGTGIGKSLAYLIPAVAWAEANGRRVVVSTATINLQEQLVAKDLPLVSRILGTNAAVALVKGRGNYVCLSRLSDALEENSLFEDGDTELGAIADWARATATGDRADLGFYPAESLWSQVASESDSCTGLRCPNRERCFVLQARRKAAAARILVVNHHLLFSDLSLRLGGAGFDSTAVLPPFAHLVFDEAHNVEASATSFFSASMTRSGLLRQLGRLIRNRRGREIGLLARMGSLVPIESKLEAIRRIDAIRGALDAAERAVLDLLAAESTLRLTPDRVDELKSAYFPAVAAVQNRTLELCEAVEDLAGRFSDEDQELPEVYETKMVVRRLERTGALLQETLHFDEHIEKVFWLERRRNASGETYSILNATPLDIGPMMREAVFEPMSTVVFASATLTIDRSFHYWKGRVGMPGPDDAETQDLIVESPFDFASRVLLGCPTDAPTPDEAGYPDYLADFVARVITASEGRALILFTSYELLQRVYETVRPLAAARGLSTFRQGDDERSRLLTRFTNDVSSVLFATDSFWEGVDSPGETLEVVVICRLPFRVPTDPVLVARMDAIRARGGNPFAELSLPDAVMRFKQGFGRLMRRTSDRGCVLVPDVRLVAKPYGRLFLASLPETRRSVKPTDDLIEDVEVFLAR